MFIVINLTFTYSSKRSQKRSQRSHSQNAAQTSGRNTEMPFFGTPHNAAIDEKQSPVAINVF